MCALKYIEIKVSGKLYDKKYPFSPPLAEYENSEPYIE
jgi:hypothetical protein